MTVLDLGHIRAALLCGALCAPHLALAQAMPDTENGRYTLAPVADGVLRLDTRTGTTSICNNKRNGWACYAMPDERAALDAEIGRLQNDNAALRERLAQREPSAGDKSAEARRGPELALPSDRDIDRAMSFLERVWRRLVEMADRVQKDVSGKI